jgi:RNA polymerase sigma-70 factor (ECF subfamily)
MPGETSFPGPLSDLARLGQQFEQHRPRLLAMVRRRLAHALARRIDPEDVLGEAFLQAQKRLTAFKKEQGLSVYAWLYCVTLDCVLEVWRRETRQRRDPQAEIPWPDRSSIQLGLGLVHPGTSPTEAAAREEMRRQMRQVLELLKDKDREILRMRHEDELTFAEAAQVLGLTENAATVRYVRAVERLRALWLKLNPQSGHAP